MLLAGIMKPLATLGLPCERFDDPRGEQPTFGHIWRAAVDVDAGVVQPTRAQHEFAVVGARAGNTLGDQELAVAMALHRRTDSRQSAESAERCELRWGRAQIVGDQEHQRTDRNGTVVHATVR